jgi:predicted esterase
MARQLIIREDTEDGFGRYPNQARQCGSSQATERRLRLRRAQTISWSFTPMGCASGMSAGTMDFADQALSTALIVWIHGDGGDSNEAPSMSTVHGDAHWLHVHMNDGIHSSTAMLANALAELREVVVLLSETYSIAPDQIYLASMGASAVLALRVLLMQPEDFLGIALFNADLSAMSKSIDIDRRSNHLRVMLANSIRSNTAVSEAISTGRFLHALGMRITTHLYLPGKYTQDCLFGDLADWINSAVG